MSNQREQEQSESSSIGNWLQVQDKLREDAKQAIFGGGLAALVTLGGAFMVGEATGGEAYLLLEIALETTRSFAGTITLALGTILGLMLTLLSFSTSMDMDLKRQHYWRVKQIAKYDMVTLVGAILCYLLLNVPITETDPDSAEPAKWMGYLYYITLVISSALGGSLITVILMLYNAIKDIIDTVAPSDYTPDIVQTESSEEE